LDEALRSVDRLRSPNLELRSASSRVDSDDLSDFAEFQAHRRGVNEPASELPVLIREVLTNEVFAYVGTLEIGYQLLGCFLSLRIGPVIATPVAV